MMRATHALVRRRRDCGALVRFVRQVDYVGSAPPGNCFTNAHKVRRDGLGPEGPRFSVAHGWLILRYPGQTAVLQHAWNVDIATGRHFDITALAEGGNSDAQYVEDVELRIALNATLELVPVFAGRSFIFRDDVFYEVTVDPLRGRAEPPLETPWTDFSTAALLRR
jgi:hypothetical protein